MPKLTPPVDKPLPLIKAARRFAGETGRPGRAPTKAERPSREEIVRFARDLAADPS